ncbi:sensor histidine kinase [Gemelliphila palaticanis]|uniref:histidine kinase n=1 Tax=Gemelliphila palaticanis TaxID=81950 RepID=A0ABX2SZM9_9BACL|nr:sensor histidine kinase [Gemella palaticanis]MBF0715911.1 sensor histidine kinase [Gemella palaticanis]NYS47841.1 sensor histidine kinase [Gemella palaticanis]
MLKFYIKDKIELLSTLVVSILSISIILYLYDLDLEIILYPITVILIVFLVYFVYDYYLFKKRIKLLNLEKENTNTTVYKINKKYPTEYNLYLEVINNLKKESIKIIEKTNIEKNNITDYYTQWVHQIKTPISALSFLIENEEDANQKRLLEAELFKIEQYVELVLTYLRLDVDKNDFYAENVKLQTLINKVIKKHSNIFIHKKISIENNVDLTVISDKKWLEFVFDQIVSNSLKYTSKGGFLKIYREENTLFIEDNGIGIQPDNLPRIFEKGYTGFNGRKDKKSSGIGLYLTKKTLDKLGHKIEITSELKKGTVVKIIFSKENIKR